jgi:hypothetical protein
LILRSWTPSSASALTAIVAALLGLLGVAVAGWSLSRRDQRRRLPRHRPGLVALSAGAIGTVLGVVVAATADGGLGRGNGFGGALVAVVMMLGGLTHRRSSRRPTSR